MGGDSDGRWIDARTYKIIILYVPCFRTRVMNVFDVIVSRTRWTYDRHPVLRKDSPNVYAVPVGDGPKRILTRLISQSNNITETDIYIIICNMIIPHCVKTLGTKRRVELIFWFEVIKCSFKTIVFEVSNDVNAQSLTLHKLKLNFPF